MEPITIQKLWQLLRPTKVFNTRGRWERCCSDWNEMDEAKRLRIYQKIQTKRQNGEYVNPNPCFALNDAIQEDEQQQAKQKKPEPTNYNGKVLTPGVEYVTAKYNGKWGTYTAEDAELYGMERAGV